METGMELFVYIFWIITKTTKIARTYVYMYDFHMYEYREERCWYDY